MSNPGPVSASRRRFLGLGAAGLLAVPVGMGILAYPKRSNGCAGPVASIDTSPPLKKAKKKTITTAGSVRKEGIGRSGGDHHQF